MPSYLVDGHATNESKTRFIAEAINKCIEVFKTERIIHLVSFGISGYDQDPRPLFQIPEVRDWCKQLYSSIPAIFLYLDSATIQWFFLSIAEIEILKVEPKEPDGLLADAMAQLSPEMQQDFRKHHPGSFLKGTLSIAQSSLDLIADIWGHGMSEVSNLSSSQDEIDRLGREFIERLTSNLPQPS
jgi:hypothetical protein